MAVIRIRRVGLFAMTKPPITVRRAEESTQHVEDSRLSVVRNCQPHISLSPKRLWVRPLTSQSSQRVGIGRIGATTRGSHSVPFLPVIQHLFPSRRTMAARTPSSGAAGKTPACCETKGLVYYISQQKRWGETRGEQTRVNDVFPIGYKSMQHSL